MRFTPRGRFPLLSNLRNERLRPLDEGRAPGLHLGAIVRRIYAESRGWSQGIDEDAAFRIQLGFLWETAIEYVLAGIPFDEAIRMAFKRYMLTLRVPPAKQLQLEKDGIQMTPDALREDDRVLESYKFSWRSSARAETAMSFAEHFEPWIIQEAAYCHALGISKVEYIVGWANGNYRRGTPEGKPQARIYEVEFTPEELVANWARILQTKREMEEEGK